MESINYREIADTTAETFQSYLTDSENWKTTKKTKEVLVETKLSTIAGNEHGHIYRAQTILNCPKETVHKYMYPVGGPESELRRSFDTDIADIQLLTRIAPDLSVNLIRTNSAAMGMIYPREFIDLMHEVQTEDSLAFHVVGVDYPDQPPNPKFVRGWIYPSGYICQDIPDQPGSTNFVLIVQSDIKGNLPRALVDTAIPGAVTGLCNNLRNMLKKHGHLKS